MTSTPQTPALSPWRMVVGLGLVSLFADVVADGGKSLYGPLLGALGASGLVVGLVTGVAGATSLLLRLVAGPLADKKGNHWSWRIGGYALTAVGLASAYGVFAAIQGLAALVGGVVVEPCTTSRSRQW